MANYFTLGYETTATSSPGVELNYGSQYSSGLTVNVSMFAGSGFTPTEYKIWGVELTAGEGVVTISGATWEPFPSNGTRTVRLARHNDPQSAYVIFKDAGESETETVQSNEVTFTFVEPTKQGNLQWESDWEALGFDAATSNKLRNPNFNSAVEFNKNKLDQLGFSGYDFSGLKIESDTIYINPSSDVGQLIGLDNNSYVTITKVFDTSEVPLIRVDYGNGFSTITAYDLEIKTTVSGENAGRITNVDWDAGTKTLTFDAYKFSTYGFTNINKIEFTADSATGVYVGDSTTFRVYVQDTNGEGVEDAPVVVSGTGDNIGTVVSGTVYTDAYGFAEFTLNSTAAGTASYTANVDDFYFTDDPLVISAITSQATQRSLLTQYEQIYRTANYDDAVSNVNEASVAEPTTPTVSGSADSVLEHDLNVLRTLIKQLKGTTDWFSDPGNYFDAESTDAGGTETKALNLSNLRNQTLDSKTVIGAVSDDNSGNGFTVNSGDEGFLYSTSLTYATPTDRRGLPVFASTLNAGSYFDEGETEDRVVGIDIIDTDTGAEFVDASGNIIFAKFHDGADNSGSGNGTDVFVKFYTSAGPYQWTASDPTNILMIFPYRKVMSEMEEYEWARTDFINSWEGDEELVEDITNLWDYAGASDGATDPSWTVISGSPIVDSSITSLKSAIDTFNDEFGSLTYTEQNYLTNGLSVTEAIDQLDQSIYDVSQSVAAGVAEKYVEVVVADIPAGTAHQLPTGLSYTPDATSGQVGSNMDVYLDGQLMSASTGTSGANADKDYAETSPTHITFHFDVYQYSNITYKIRE
jgi:hypothetical protein